MRPGFDVQFNAELCGISRSSAILGSDSPQSNNTRGNSIFVPSERPNVISAVERRNHWQTARRLWPDRRRLQLTLDDCCRLVLRTMPNSMLTEQILNDSPRMGAKSTRPTTSNHHSTLGDVVDVVGGA